MGEFTTRKIYMFGTIILLPLGLLASAAGLVVGFVFGNWTVLWIGLACAIGGPILAFGSMALLAQRVQSAASSFMTNQRLEDIAAGRADPLVGLDLPWKDMAYQVFRVLEFDRTDTKIVDDRVVDTGAGKPYGFLRVESPILNQPARLPIFHRDDFWLAASVYDEPQFAAAIEQEELLVTYAPRVLKSDGFSGDAAHAMHYILVPRGTLQRYYDFNNSIHMRKPEPKKLFGPFVYDGTISVGLNRVPTL